MSASSEQPSDLQLEIRVDDTSPTVLYFGDAPPNSPTSAPVWRIFRILTSSGFALTYADRNTQFDNIWDNRASLTY